MIRLLKYLPVVLTVIRKIRQRRGAAGGSATGGSGSGRRR
jgi:hypothetical protein